MTAEVPQPNGEIKRVPYPGTTGAPTGDDPHDLNHMIRISAMIADLQSIFDRFGDTCVYVRRRGLAWGSVALHYRDDDRKYGIFDLQAEHDRRMIERLGQIERLIADRNGERDARWKLEKALSEKDKAMGVLFARMTAAGIDYSDLIS